MKILWISETLVPTGFARVSQSIVSRLNKKHDITVLDWYQTDDSFNLGVRVTGKLHANDEFGIDKMLKIYNKYDAIYILNDVWNINKYLAALKKDTDGIGLPKIIVYFPVDAKLHNPKWYENFNIITHAVTYTKFAKDVVGSAVPSLKKHIKIIPHGVDTNIFFKSPMPKADIRHQLWKKKTLTDAFIFMSAHRNNTRKRLDITIRAFAQFLKITGAKDAWLHLHCGLMDFGVPIPTLIKQFKVDNRIMLTNNQVMMQNIPTDLLNLYYNAADVGLNSSLAEGWSLTNCEHAVTGAPQIMPNHSACKELFTGRGALIDTVADAMLDGSFTMGKLVDYKHMAMLMAAYYMDSKSKNEKSSFINDGLRGQKYFCQKQFSWSAIADQWNELFIS